MRRRGRGLSDGVPETHRRYSIFRLELQWVCDIILVTPIETETLSEALILR